jgi:AcrR family transcriptional regulator
VPTRTRKKRETYHHGDLSNALVAAAIDIISEDEELTLREVSRRVGVNHRAVYRHFADLSALLAAVAEQGYRELTASMEAALAELGRAPAEKRLEAIAVAYVSFAVDHPAHYRIMFGRRLNEDGRFPVLEEVVMKAFEVLDAEMLTGVEAGRFVPRPRRETAFAFWSLAHGFASLALVRRIKVKRPLLDAYVRQLVAPLLAGLRER